MNRLYRTLVTVILTAFLSTGILMPFAAKASEQGRKNTTLVLGGVTGVLAAKKKWVPAAVAGVGTYVAYHNWQAAINARHRRENQLRTRHAYRLGYRHGYSIAHRTRHTRRHRR